MSLSESMPPAEANPRAEVEFHAVEAGKALFVSKGGCIKCHPLRDLPGFNLRAPSLLSVGRHDAGYLLESIREPSKRITSGYETWNVVLSSGRVCSGRLLQRNDETLVILSDEAGAMSLKTISLTDIERDDHGDRMLRRNPKSAMPDDYTTTLSPSEIELIVKFLMTLRSS
jgi:putative heme-binding domain-containing protein